MTVSADVTDELRSLRARVPHLTGALVASVDGLVLAHDTGSFEEESIAALTAVALGVGIRLAGAAGQGAFRELLVQSEQGCVAVYAAGATAVVAVLAPSQVTVGRLHLEARRCTARVADLVDTASGRADTSR